MVQKRWTKKLLRKNKGNNCGTVCLEVLNWVVPEGPQKQSRVKGENRQKVTSRVRRVPYTVNLKQTSTPRRNLRWSGEKYLSFWMASGHTDAFCEVNQTQTHRCVFQSLSVVRKPRNGEFFFHKCRRDAG